MIAHAFRFTSVSGLRYFARDLGINKTNKNKCKIAFAPIYARLRLLRKVNAYFLLLIKTNENKKC
ncbi:hypothetical protein EAO06_03600 [Klebsiella pneumoniae]|nr:hypothetical protein EAO06_03600 [Klebsiella pneumoniae]